MSPKVMNLALVMFLIFLPMVISRECFECLSTTSWKDCDANRRRVTCLTSTQCLKANAHSSKEDVYLRGCARTCYASSVSVCREPGVTCNVDCCSRDYCNGVNSRMASTLVMMASAVIFFLFGY